MATMDDYRNNTGDFAPEQETAPDAEVQEQEVDIEPEYEDIDDVPEAPEPTVQTLDTDDVAELPPREQTAFEKRMERERKKMQEQIEREYEQKYSRHKQVVDKLGGDPDAIERMIKDREIQSQAERLAYEYGWDEQQTQYYVKQEQDKLQQQQLQNELRDLRISNEINDLRDKPEFSGIKSMQKEIADLVSRSNGTLNVEQAYWALGGQQRAAQVKREVEQRAAFDRRTGRVVTKDAPSAASTEQAIPPSVLADAKRWGLTEKDIRELASFDAKNINEYRQKKAK